MTRPSRRPQDYGRAWKSTGTAGQLEKEIQVHPQRNLQTFAYLSLPTLMAARLGLSRVAPGLLKARHLTSAVRAYATQAEHSVRFPGLHSRHGLILPINR